MLSEYLPGKNAECLIKYWIAELNAELKKNAEYPLVTHDPNMLKKVTRELSWKIKVSLPEGNSKIFGRNSLL